MGDGDYKYQNTVLNCNNDSDCIVNCTNYYSCRNATINCPINPFYDCTVVCIGDRSCLFADINWTKGANNSLSCDYHKCSRTLYPLSSNDNTSWTVNCRKDYECFGTIIQCPQSAPCYVNCIGEGSCWDSIFHCPTSELCDIKCIGTKACLAAIVYWPSDYDFANFTCPDGGTQCNLIEAPKIINYEANNIWINRTRTFECTEEKQCTSSIINCPSQERCIINCTASSSTWWKGGVCAGSIINCPTDSDCSIICDGYSACRAAKLNGPTNQKIEIICSDSNACYEMEIHAESASYLNLTMEALGFDTAQAISIWFPSGNESFKRSYIIAMDDGLNGGYGYIPTQFYALNGFEDIHIDYQSTDYSRHGGIMHCHDGYLDSCWFANDSYSCNDRNTICDYATRPPNSKR